MILRAASTIAGLPRQNLLRPYEVPARRQETESLAGKPQPPHQFYPYLLNVLLGGRMAERYWMGRQRPCCCGFESRAPHREGGHVTVMLRGVLIGWFDPGWQVFHLS